MAWLSKVFGRVFGGGRRAKSKGARARWDPIREKFQGKVRGMLVQSISDALHRSTSEDPPGDRERRRQATANTVFADALYEIMATGVEPSFEPPTQILKWAQSISEDVLDEWLSSVAENDEAVIASRKRLAAEVLEALRKASSDDVLRKAAAARLESATADQAA